MTLLDDPPLGKGKAVPSLNKKGTLQIIIYGPYDLYEEVGSFFENHDIYLQDPLECQRDIPYCNPHRLSRADPSTFLTTSMVAQLFAMTSNLLHDVKTLPELLDILNSLEDLSEATQPRSIKTTLAKFVLSTYPSLI